MEGGDHGRCEGRSTHGIQMRLLLGPSTKVGLGRLAARRALGGRLKSGRVAVVDLAARAAPAGRRGRARGVEVRGDEHCIAG